jgi:hypothetical protein
LKAGETTELIIAKAPNYVEVYPVTAKNGYTTFSPPDIKGTYTLLLSCKNKEIIQQFVS